MFGFGTAVVNDKLQLCGVEIYYDAEEFISVLRGQKTVDEVNADWNSGAVCPFAAMQKAKSEAEEPLRLGTGAIVSFPVKVVHPARHRDAAYPDRKTGQRINGATVLNQGMMSINNEMVMCVFVRHTNFKDKNGKPVEVWVKKSHVKVEKEGNPDMFF